MPQNDFFQQQAIVLICRALCILVIATTQIRCVNCEPSGEEELINVATQKGLDYVRHISLPYLEDELKSLKFPPVGSTANTPIGNVVYLLSRIHVSTVKLGDSNLTISHLSGLHALAHKAVLGLNAHWHYRQQNWPHIKDDGEVKVSMNGIELEVVLVLDTRNEVNPLLVTKQCKFGIGNLDLKFNGGASWLYNMFSGIIAKDIKTGITKQICSMIASKIDNEGDKLLAVFPGVVKIVGQHIHLFKKVSENKQGLANAAKRFIIMLKKSLIDKH